MCLRSCVRCCAAIDIGLCLGCTIVGYNLWRVCLGPCVYGLVLKWLPHGKHCGTPHTHCAHACYLGDASKSTGSCVLRPLWVTHTHTNKQKTLFLYLIFIQLAYNKHKLAQTHLHNNTPFSMATADQPPSTSLREDLIANAVGFLSNPKVPRTIHHTINYTSAKTQPFL